MDLYVIRHATTQWNLERRYQGHTDTSLAEIGRQEALAWRSRLPSDPSEVWASSLSRAVETAQLIYPAARVRTSPDLKEMNLGSWEGLYMEEIAQTYPDLVGRWSGLDAAPHGGESFRKLIQRVQNWLDGMSREPAGSAVVVTHKMTAQAFYCLATGWDVTERPKDRLRFPRIHRFRWDGQLHVLSLNESLDTEERE